MRNVGVTGTGYYVPIKKVSNYDLESIVDTSDEWIFKKTGIKERRIASLDEATSDLASIASMNAIKDANISVSDIDLIVVATSSPDMIQPSTASILQGKIGAHNAVAFDVSAVCAGFIYAISVAVGMMKGLGDYKRALVVGAETYSRILDYKDRETCVFFGDGAGAAVLEEVAEGYGYKSSYLMNDGRGCDVIKFPGGGSRTPTTYDTIDKGLHAFKMDGKRVWDFAIKAFPESIKEACKRADIEVCDIDIVISHQANINIINESMRSLGLSTDKTYTTIEKYGNTSGASVPITLAEASEKGLIKKGDIVAMVGFGGGLSWGSTIFKWFK